VMPGKFTEDQLVEQPAIALFAELGWTTVNAMHETLGPDGTLGRATQQEVVLGRHLKAALTTLNPDLPSSGIALAVDELTKDRSAMDPIRANRELHQLIRDGVPVKVRVDDGSESASSSDHCTVAAA
jgi:type I restriction enzyme R subunit